MGWEKVLKRWVFFENKWVGLQWLVSQQVIILLIIIWLYSLFYYFLHNKKNTHYVLQFGYWANITKYSKTNIRITSNSTVTFSICFAYQLFANTTLAQ